MSSLNIVRILLLLIPFVEGIYIRTTKMPKARQYDYIGCYEYPNKTSFDKTILKDHTKTACQEHCGSGNNVFGTAMGKCYCGNSVIGNKVGDDWCYWPCVDAMCGGPYRFSMYEAIDIKATTLKVSTTTTVTITTTTTSMTSELPNSSDFNNSTLTLAGNIYSPNYILWTVVSIVAVIIIIVLVVLIHCMIPRCLIRTTIQANIQLQTVNETVNEPSTSYDLAHDYVQISDTVQRLENRYRRGNTRINNINSGRMNRNVSRDDSYDRLNYNQS